MSDLEWKPEPSKLNMFEDGEAAIVGDWQLEVFRIKDIREDGMLGALFGGLSEKEKKVLDMRFGLDGERNLEEEAYEARKKEGRKTHPWVWKIHHVGDGSPSPFTHMGGSARTADEAKVIAEHVIDDAIQCLESAVDTLRNGRA